MVASLRHSITVLSISLWNTIWGQEYLPPKAGGKKATPEPSLPANYDFAYAVQDSSASLDFGHVEERKDDKVSGSYHVLLPDGRMQLVEYTAGNDGFKPLVMYMGKATYPSPAPADKFDGYHYNAASNRQSVRQPAPRGTPRQASAAPPPPRQVSAAPPPPVIVVAASTSHAPAGNGTQTAKKT